LKVEWRQTSIAREDGQQRLGQREPRERGDGVREGLEGELGIRVGISAPPLTELSIPFFLSFCFGLNNFSVIVI